LSSRINNYKRMAERRVVFTIGVTYQTPPHQVEKLPAMLRAIVEAQERVRFDRAHFRSYGDFALVYEIVYWMLTPDYTAYMDAQQRINFAIYRQLQAEGIEFAYPTQTIFMAPPAQAEASGA
jgi:small-conductance mechanosensitive channel